MLAKTRSVALIGADAHLVEVEVDVGTGIPGFRVVGLPTASVREAEQRTRSAIESAGEAWPKQRVVANLAPAGLRKEGTHFDLALACGVLAAKGKIDSDVAQGWLYVGELALDGSVRPVRGVVAAAIAARSAGLRGVICPAANAAEAVAIEGIEVVPVETFRQCVDFLRLRWRPAPVEVTTLVQEVVDDMREVCGHEGAKRALEIAAAGGHNVLMLGPPGSGKTMLARRMPGIMPPMSQEESLDVTRIHSVAGVLPEGAGLISTRPFRSPHHHVSMAGLVGGGPGLARPGEISLAHHGVLFLDELPLYRGDVLESLRGPLEDGRIRLARSGGAVTFPTRFSLVAAMNPCPCGYEGDRVRTCRCSESDRTRYFRKLSGPLLDRIDMQLSVPRLTKHDLLQGSPGEDSRTIRERVAQARKVQAERFGSTRLTNASAPKRDFEKTASLGPDATCALEQFVDALYLSGRAVERAVRVARTIADLNGRSSISGDDVSLGMTYRMSHPYEDLMAS
ncbi:MAG TPA: YifB family Mg chelatase-like AAA ATPase [Actinomycetota bacterium]|nr:YifB family Mg chelatase-like AAA ATPase [Actinomycetota bacterium]